MVLFDLKLEIREAILDCLLRLMYWFNGPALSPVLIQLISVEFQQAFRSC